MQFNSDMVDELNTLALFNLESTQQGIKVHKDADPATIQATKRLHDKGLISQEDGGYLTDLGIEVAEHVLHITTILSAK